jgi:flagellar hook-associated protein 2
LAIGQSSSLNELGDQGLAISFGSINTGLPKDIVQQIMAAEKIPLDKLENNKSKLGEKKILVDELIKLVNEAKGTIAKNGNARSLRELMVETNEDILGVTVDKNIADPGSFQFEVLQLARKSSAMTSGFEDPNNSYVGVGFIQYFLPNGENRSIYVDSDHASLNGIAKLINSDVKNGMKAYSVNDGSGSDSPWRMIISLDETGDEKKAIFPYFYFVDGEKDFYLEFEREAQDAKIRLDGMEIELPENKTSDLIPGVTLDLKKAAPGSEFSVNITENLEAIQQKVGELVVKLNDILQFIKTQNNLDENSDTSRTLGGEITLQSMEGRIRNTIFKQIETNYGPRRIGDLGITFQRSGLLESDNNILQSKINENYDEISQILTGYFRDDGKRVDGFIQYLDDALGSTIRLPDGLLYTRKKGVETKIEQIDRRIRDKQRLIEQKEKNLKNRFSRLEAEIAKIKGQGAGLAALTGSANTVDQLQQLG